MSLFFLCHRRTAALAIMAAADKIGLIWQTPQADPTSFRKCIATEQPRIAIITDEYLNDPSLFTSIRTASAETIITICLLSSLPPGKSLWKTLDNLEFDVLTTVNEVGKCLDSIQKGCLYQSSLLEAHFSSMSNETLLNRDDLTPAEQRVLTLMVHNKTGPQIADILCISAKTVNNHKAKISQKLNVSGGPGSLTRYVLLHREQLLDILT